MTCKDCIHFNYCPDKGEYLHYLKSTCHAFTDKNLYIKLPYPIGTHLWRVTHPYRQDPKVTEFVVKNFKTIGRHHKIQVEVQALNAPITNWMYTEDFYTSKEEAEAALKKEAQK